MTINRTKTWAYGEKLTSDQLNALDTSATTALDKRAGQTDTLASTITLTGGIFLASGGSIVAPSGANFTVYSAALATINLGASSSLTQYSGSTWTVNSGTVANINLTSSSNLTIGSTATQNIASGGALTVNAGGGLTISSGGSQTVAGALTIASGGSLTIASGGELQVAAGAGFSTSASSDVDIHVGSGSTLVIASDAIVTGHPRLMSTAVIEKTGGNQTISAALTAVTGMSLTIANTKAGDIVIIHASIILSSSSGSDTIFLQITEDGIQQSANQSSRFGEVVTANVKQYRHFHTIHTVVTDGTLVVTPVGSSGFGNTMTVYGSSNTYSTMTYQLFRP